MRNAEINYGYLRFGIKFLVRTSSRQKVLHFKNKYAKMFSAHWSHDSERYCHVSRATLKEHIEGSKIPQER